MTLEEIHKIIVNNRAKLKNQIHQNIYQKLKISTKSEETEELLSEIIYQLLDKLATGEKTVDDFKTESKLLNYISKAACQLFLDTARKKKTKAKNFNTQEFISLYYTDSTEEPEISTSKLYNDVIEYVYERYSYLEAGIFKTYTLNKISITQVSEVTGYSRGHCFSIIKKIKDDIKKNKHLFFKSAE